MTVLMSTDTVGGVWSYGVELARSLRERGVAVVLAAMGGPLSAAQRAQVASERLEVRESSFRLEWMEDPWADVAAAGEWLLTLARAVRADVIHLNGYAHAALPWQAPVLVTAHSCVCSWWRAVHECPAPAEWSHYRREVAAGLAAADLVVAPTRALRDAVEREYGRIPRSEVIANGTRASAVADTVRAPYVASMGRLWDPAKNLGVLRDAAPALPWPIRVAGPLAGPDGRQADPGALEPVGALAPHEARAFLAGAAVYAAPALYEPFGLAILEAAQAGCPLVLGDIATLRELWHGAALFVPPRDAAALAAALRRLVADEPLRMRLGRRARARAARYTPALMADAYLRAYRRIQEGYRRATPICA